MCLIGYALYYSLMAQITVLGIVGSPRKDGNTAILVDEVLSGAEEAAAQTEKVSLNELHIAPCQNCNACQKLGTCRQKDDMQSLLEQMRHSQGWVLGTPVYWWGPTAQFKLFLDRWYGARQMEFREHKAILVIPLGGGVPSYARHTVGILTNTLNYVGTDLIDTILAPGSNRKGVVKERPDLMSRAHKMGQKFAKSF